MIIAIVNGKGGVGKTTVSLLLAAALRKSGAAASLEDRDPQQTATAICPALGIPLAGGQIILIDTAPRLDHASTLSAFRDADKVVLVTTPSPADLASTAATARVIQEERGRRQGVTVLFNNVQHNRFEAIMESTASALPFPLASVHIRRRACYQAALVEGWMALTGEAREEIQQAALAVIT